MASSGKLTVACVVLAAGSMAGTALAQTPTGETGRILAPGETLTQDVIRFFGGATLEHHSNIFRLADGVDPTGLFGKSKRSDTLLMGEAGVQFDREFSRQRLRLDARLNPTKYSTYSQLDYVGYSAGGTLNWAVGSAFYGDFGARFGQVQTSFIGTQYGGDKNLERRNRVFFTGGVRMTPNWSVFGQVNHENLDNSLGQSAFQAANYRLTGTEAGLRYEPGSGTEISILGAHSKATYPNLQTVDIFGTPIATPISNDYKQNALLVRLLVRPNEDASLTGDLGYTKREYDAVSSRNFGGPTARLEYRWRPGPGFFLGTELIRGLSSANILTANYIDNKEFWLRPTLVLTGKLQLAGDLGYLKVGWKGDPGLTTQTTGGREDTMNLYGVRLIYDYSRVLSMNAGLRREHRSSNYSTFDYNNNIISVGIQARF